MDELARLSFEMALKMNHCSDDNINKYMERITKIRRYEELVEISNNRDDVLWPWVATLVFNIFGYEVYKSCNLNIDSDRTYILFHPSSEYDFSVVEEIKQKLNCVVTRKKYKFSKRLVARLYGGFPWFMSYCMACDEMELWDRVGIAFELHFDITENNLRRLVEIKNKYRDSHPERIVKFYFPNMKYSGIIHPFHTPNPIENQSHCNAIDEELVK